ncbi:hypothetical protein F4801DRAFT_577342 [Xylaria longipes]|nr:hypothetical protein F4801DRAFT_577342 [Xylaria longipes]
MTGLSNDTAKEGVIFHSIALPRGPDALGALPGAAGGSGRWLRHIPKPFSRITQDASTPDANPHDRLGVGGGGGGVLRGAIFVFVVVIVGSVGEVGKAPQEIINSMDQPSVISP